MERRQDWDGARHTQCRQSMRSVYHKSQFVYIAHVYELALHPFVIYSPHALPTLCVPSSIPILSPFFLYHPYIQSVGFLIYLSLLFFCLASAINSKLAYKKASYL